MWVFVAGRCLQGLGAGAVPAVAYVAIGRSLRETQRARMMAVLSTAWVIPGVLGPGVAAAVAHLAGWRWVFLGLIPLVAIAGPIAVPALVRLGKPDTGATEEHGVADAVRTAGGAALVLAALGAHNIALGIALAAVGFVVGLPSLRRLLPAGTLRASRGLPATILSRALVTFAFFGADAYVTLTITTVRHHSTAMAGAVVTASTLAWTVGAWIQAKLNDTWEGARLVRTGLILILAGTAGMAWQLRPGVPVWEAFVAWSVAGLGMGLSYAPISLMMLRVAPAGREGWASASLNLADVLGIALGVGVGGAAVASASSRGQSVAAGVLVAFAAAGLAATLALVIARRLPGSLDRAPVSQINE
jgi:MFS family permease